MTDGVYLDGPLASAGAAELSGAGQDLINILGTSGSELTGTTQARPWGSDEIGNSFDQGYRPAEQQFLAALGALGGHVRTLGEQVTAVVATLGEADQTSGVRVHETYRGH